jgi:hypothetical protein
VAAPFFLFEGGLLLEVINLTGKDADEIKKAMDSGTMVYIGHSMKNHRFYNVRKKWGWLEDSFWRNKNMTGSRATRLSRFELDLIVNAEMKKRLPELKGKTLACWCKPEPCHGDILIEHVEKL